MKALLTQSEKEILFKEYKESGKTYTQVSANRNYPILNELHDWMINIQPTD